MQVQAVVSLERWKGSKFEIVMVCTRSFDVKASWRSDDWKQCNLFPPCLSLCVVACWYGVVPGIRRGTWQTRQTLIVRLGFNESGISHMECMRPRHRKHTVMPVVVGLKGGRAPAYPGDRRVFGRIMRRASPAASSCGAAAGCRPETLRVAHFVFHAARPQGPANPRMEQGRCSERCARTSPFQNAIHGM